MAHESLHVVRMVLKVSIFSMIPATALSDIPLRGTVADVLDALITDYVRGALRVYEIHRKK